MKKNMRIKNILPKMKAGVLVLLMMLAFFVGSIDTAKALTPMNIINPTSVSTQGSLGQGLAAATPGMVVTDIGAKTQTIIGRLITTIKENAATWYKKYGTQIYSTTLRNTLNKVALDAAQYVASAGEGQKPQYIVEDYKDYWKNIGDAAAGDFIDEVGKSWQLDLCQPPDPAVRLKIGLGLTQAQAPQAPNCTLSQLTTNYTSAYEKYQAMQTGDYLKALQINFEPGGGELGAAFTVFGRTVETSTKATADAEKSSAITGGWLDVRNIAGNLKSTPGNAKATLDTAKQTQAQALLSTTGDALLDASNIFLNQLAYEGMQRALREISKGKSTSVVPSSAFTSLIQYGEKVVSEKLATIIKPRFDVRSDYSVLSDLAICPDKNNPGPNNCVIDQDFSQAISEKLTVGEALAQGYLHGDWLVTTNNKSDSAYTLRSASILRKFRIVPVGWEQAIAAATNKKVTFQDLVSCFDGKGNFSADFDQNNKDWCTGLVDPNWVLKAPLNSCAKQGAGGLIDSSLVSKDENGLSTLVVSRNSDYCADEQTCIKEKGDGSCELYGYCNEEKRTWNFSTDSCDAVYNTCQTFSNATNNNSVSYLENTLDYSTCNADNSGCKQYVYGGAYSSSTAQIAWDKKYSIYFNRKAADCSATSEGCTKLFRGKPGWTDVNYVMDASYDADTIGDSSTSTDWHFPISPAQAVGTIANPSGDGVALYLDGPSGTALYSDNTKSLLPKDMAVIPGWSYTLSADVKLLTADKVTMILGDNTASVDLTDKSGWKTITVTASTVDQGLNNLNFKLTGSSSGTQAGFAVRNLKLNPNNYQTNFNPYGVFPAYEKLIPAYLESTCYNNITSGTNDYRLKDNAPSVCGNYARKCNREEVGCELFTAVKDLFAVAAKANSSDYCNAQCVGYDTYLAKSSYFYGASADNIIPQNTKTCSAESDGCASFTNLDAAGAGGENLEYYATVRQCIKPDTASCGDFYSWDNSQLKVMSLKKDSSGNPGVVDATSDALCNKDIYNLAPSDPSYNPDCREFYSKSGQITYHIYSNTISCSDNCHTYRLNEKNIDKTLTTKATCESGTSNSWDSTQGACYVCKNGGVWDAKQNACLYQAIPDEGTVCAAEEVGCREYNGNNGNNLKQVANYDFESGTDGFVGFLSGTVAQSLESTAKNGHSLAYTGTGNNGFAVDASTYAKKGSAYVIKFMAKAGTDVTANFYLMNDAGAVSTFNVDDNNATGNIAIKGSNQWNLFEINLKNLDHDVSGEKLVIKANNNLFIDHIIVNEVSDRYFLIKGSSQVPDICSYDMSGKYQGPNYNLGCSQYKDRAGTINNLHQFSELCQDSAVGCEQMIQTNNSSDYYGYTLNLNAGDRNTACTPGAAGCLEVKGHQAVYAVYDPTKLCNIADVGCSRFAYSQTSGAMTTWVDSYKKNLPDTFKSDTGSPLCQANEVGCDTWSADDGASSYFKDPGLNTCVYQDGAWQKTAVKRCDTNISGGSNGKITGTEQSGPTCSTDSDCGLFKCITDTNKYSCDVSTSKTFGAGGAGGLVSTPVGGAVGICSADQSTCSEYIDPVSKFVNNLVYNPNAEDIDKDGVADKWQLTNDPKAGYFEQRVNLKANKLYILQVSGSATQPVVLDKFATSDTGVSGQVQILNSTSTNELGDLTPSISSTSSVLFYTRSNTYLTVHRFGTKISSATDTVGVTIKEAIINYQLSSSVDTKSCTNANTDAGCILFNARTQNGASGLKKLIFNAAITGDNAAPVSCQGSDCTANQLIKVSPDRVCSRWLSCRSYIEDPITKERTCYSMGECDSLDDKNECINFLPSSDSTRVVTDTQNKNATGYALLNNYFLGDMKEVGQNTDAHFDFEDSAINLSCRRDVGIAAGTPLYALKDTPCDFDKNINESLVLEPNGSPTSYPAHGKGYLKVINYYQMSPMSNNSSISIYTNQDYYVNYLINTKGSNAKAKLIISDEAGKVISSFTDDASNGWTRKVYSFHVDSASTAKSPTKIKIYLTSDVTDLNPGYVYFDDINIEPVLQTGVDDNGQKKYTAKDCRLYPSDDSLSCLSANNNVIKDGLYGYCLQYDPLNPGVCLMWYPVDQISPVTRNSQSTLGYSGKFPLYYCSEVNGNFNLKKKIKTVKVDDWVEKKGSRPVCTLLPDLPVTPANYRENCDYYCGNCTTDYDAVIMHSYGSTDRQDYYVAYCIPKVGKTIPVSGTQKTVTELNSTKDACDSISFFDEAWTDYGPGFVKRDYLPTCDHDKDPTQCDNFDESKIASPNIAFYDPSSPPATENDLEYAANPDPNKVFRLTCNRFTEVVDNEGNNMAWAGRLSRNTIYPTSTPQFFYNLNKNFSYAPLPGDTGNNGAPTPVNCNDDSECQTGQTCVGALGSCDTDPNYLGQPADCNIGQKSVCDQTTGCVWNFFKFGVCSTGRVTTSNPTLYLYGRNREDVPFGAAVLPSNYDLSNSSKIVLRNQYSAANNETIFAGRPYGCSSTPTGNPDDGCSHIGQCSLNPNVFCFYGGSGESFANFNNQSCSAGGYGTCIPLWGNTAPLLSDSSSILDKLFIKSYGDLSYNNGYQSTASDFLWANSGIPRTSIINQQCSNNVRPASDPIASFCTVWPEITNVNLKFNNTVMQMAGNDINNLNLDQSGLYLLEFNTSVNLEQQPLKQIVINWGDSVQVVTNLDVKPTAGTPHQFYHFYTKGERHIEIKIIDNWGSWQCLRTYNGNWEEGDCKTL